MIESSRLLHPGSPGPSSHLWTSRSPVAWGCRRGAGRARVAVRARGGVCAQPARRARPPGPSRPPPAWRPSSLQPPPLSLLTWRSPPAACRPSSPARPPLPPLKVSSEQTPSPRAAQGDGFLKLCLEVALLPGPLRLVTT